MDILFDFIENTLQNPDWFGIPYAKYLGALVAFVFLYALLKRMGRLARLYFITTFTSRGRTSIVRSNVDGDTIKVSKKGDKSKKASIRMIGVDTPESLKSLYMDIAPFGKEASNFTRKKLKPGQKVFLIYDVEPLDKFGRELVYVYTATGEFYNATLIREGYAFAAEYKPNLKYARFFRKLEAKAKKKGKRLWAVYDKKGELTKEYKRSKAYRRFKYKHRGKKS